MKKVVCLDLKLMVNTHFTLDKYWLKIWVENSVSAIQHIENRKMVKVLSPSDEIKVVVLD